MLGRLLRGTALPDARAELDPSPVPGAGAPDTNANIRTRNVVPLDAQNFRSVHQSRLARVHGDRVDLSYLVRERRYTLLSTIRTSGHVIAIQDLCARPFQREPLVPSNVHRMRGSGGLCERWAWVRKRPVCAVPTAIPPIVPYY